MNHLLFNLSYQQLPKLVNFRAKIIPFYQNPILSKKIFFFFYINADQFISTEFFFPTPKTTLKFHIFNSRIFSHQDFFFYGFSRKPLKIFFM